MAKTLPQEFFISEAVYQKELSRIFSRHWICIGHESELKDGGDYFVTRVAGQSLIVLRARDCSLRSFYNVCRHRGATLCENERGHAAMIQCPYHAWTYNLDGNLVAAPHMDEVDGFDKSSYGLREVKVESWEGLIFLNLATEPERLHDYFSPLADKFAHWNLRQLKSARRLTYEVASNWKLVFQNYSECYHCPLVHPALQKITPYDLAENDLTEGAFLGGFMPMTSGRSLTMSGNHCARQIGEMKADDHQKVFYYSIFPNLLLSLHPDYVMVHQILPEAPGRTNILCDWYFHPEAFDAPDFNPGDAIEFWDLTNRQDWHVCELSQRGISSSAYQPGPYSRRESIPAAWDREYLRQLGKLEA